MLLEKDNLTIVRVTVGAAETGYNMGHRDGYRKGLDAGIADGVKHGEHIGYGKGWAECEKINRPKFYNRPVSWIHWLGGFGWGAFVAWVFSVVF